MKGKTLEVLGISHSATLRDENILFQTQCAFAKNL